MLALAKRGSLAFQPSETTTDRTAEAALTVTALADCAGSVIATSTTAARTEAKSLVNLSIFLA
jgi:hypothetical protein